MRPAPKTASIALLLTMLVCTAVSQQQSTSRPISNAQLRNAAEKHQARPGQSLTDDDRLSLIAAALEVRARGAEPDCSHLVHAIYEGAGFAYPYAPSSDLYAGVDSFQRVKQPQPGDLVVWRGHTGIVIKPSEHLFFSFLTTGPGIDDYTTAYWKHRGKPRFYRYLRNPFGPHKPSPQLVRTNRVRRPPSDAAEDNGP